MFDFVRLTVGAVVILLLPGYALLSVGRRPLQLDWVEALCMAAGLSLAAVPLLLYLTTLLGANQGPGMVWALLALCALVAVWDWRVARQEHGTYRLGHEQRWVYAALFIVLVFTLISRLWPVRDVAFPAWTDSYGHAVITQMVIDQGRVPVTYAPYAPIDDFTYHFGVHALAAWLHWLTGAPVLHGLVILGQLLNVLVVPTTYLFATRLFDSRVAGLTATVLVALMSHMPAQFVNWGRYTQLDGQMLLPIAVTLFLALLRPPPSTVAIGTARYGLLALNVAAFAGLFVTHYRVFVFGVMLAALLWAWAMLAPPAGQSRARLLGEAALLTVAGLLVLAPWLWHLAQGFGGAFATTMVSGYEAQNHGAYYHFDPQELLDFGMYAPLWVLAAVGTLWGLVRRKGEVIVLLLWMLVAFAGANLHYLNFTPLYSNTIFIIALYLPLATLIGYLAQEVVTWLAARGVITPPLRRTLAVGLGVALVVLGVGTVRAHTRLFAPENIFVRTGDVAAAAWIEQEVAPDALFYIATSFWTPFVAHGLDGGYFLPLLAGRQTVMPPQHYASDGTLEYRTFVNQRVRDLHAAEAHAPQDVHALWQVLHQYGISHVYIGVRATQLDAAWFAARPDLFTLLYQQDGVTIYAVR